MSSLLLVPTVYHDFDLSRFRMQVTHRRFEILVPHDFLDHSWIPRLCHCGDANVCRASQISPKLASCSITDLGFVHLSTSCETKLVKRILHIMRLFPPWESTVCCGLSRREFIAGDLFWTAARVSDTLSKIGKDAYALATYEHSRRIDWRRKHQRNPRSGSECNSRSFRRGDIRHQSDESRAAFAGARL